MVDKAAQGWHRKGMNDVIDARGLMCPLPVLRLGKALRGVPQGEIVHIWADDPIAVIDIPNFCREAGHELLAQSDAGDHQTYTIKRGADRA